MSRSNLIKFSLFLFVVAAPKLVSAKTLTFEDKTWEITPQLSSATKVVLIRNDLDFSSLAKAAVLGQTYEPVTQIWDNSTANKINAIASEINQPAKDAKLVLEEEFAKEFEPGQNGQGLDVYALKKLLLDPQSSATLPVITSQPTRKLSETNNLGINELVAVGESDFTGSPANRVHNVKVGATKFNGLIIEQGEEFSFNKYLGDVDGEHGFLPELVIKASGVTPEFGGGLCQVSSTAFRAAMNGGLPITSRRNHSFAVQYYAPQGTDATIYPGVQDMKFINDTSGPLLVRTKIEDHKLYFEYYGTKDNRAVAFEGPEQYDKKPDGSMKATWTRHVTQNGETITQVFKSTYQPPALFHKEVQASTPNPETQATPNNTPPPTPNPVPVTQ